MTTIVLGGSGMVGKNLQTVCPDFIYLGSKDGDLTKMEDTEAIFRKYQPVVVVNLAARVAGLYGNMKNNLGMFQGNLDMNINIIKCCEKYKVEKMICCLSTCIFPDGIALPLREDKVHQGPPHTSNFGYSYSKRIVDVMCDLMEEKYGYKYIRIIPTNIYGLHDNFNPETAHVIPDLIHKCYKAKNANTPFEIRGSGVAMRQFIYAKDLAKIIKHIYTNYESIQERRIICSPSEEQEVSIKNVVDSIADGMDFDKKGITYNTAFSDGQIKKTCDNSVLVSVLPPDFKFTSLEEGMTETVEWFCENYQTVRK